MNAKQCHKLRKISEITGTDYKVLKKVFKGISWDLRRQRILDALRAAGINA